VELIICQSAEHSVKRDTRRLGHENVFVPESVIRICVPMIHIRDWDRSV
jgi:hypothetical protein